MSTNISIEPTCAADGLEARGPVAPCEAHDLKRILTQLVEQIADADRRHSQALSAMQDRLGALGSAAQGLRDQLPKDMMPMMDKIEGGMSALSDRLIEAESQRRDAPQLTHNRTPADEPAPALKSAMGADAFDAFTRRNLVARGTSGMVIDHFDVVDSDHPSRDDEPWDELSAEALMHVYDTDMARLAGDTSAKAEAPKVDDDSSAPVSSAPATEPTAAQPSDVVETSRLGASDTELHLLEKRLVDVTTLLEKSLTGLKSDSSLETINGRFNMLEEKLGRALTGMASRADLAALQSIESQVEDLTAQLISAQTHFSRLDNIELELRSLSDHLSSSSFAKAFEHLAPQQQDSEALAGVVASRVAQQLPPIEAALRTMVEQLSVERLSGLIEQKRPREVDPAAIARLVAQEMSLNAAPVAADQTAADRLDELRELIEAFAAQQRHGDEQTNTMLDTMQQAMIRLLDRMDAIEHGRYGEADLPAGDPPAYPQDRHAESVDYHHDIPPEHGRRRSDLMTEPPYAEPVAAPQPPRQEEQQVAVNLQPEPKPPLSVVHEPAPSAPVVTGGHPLRKTVQQTVVNDAGRPASGPAARDDFVASARRAARLAADTPPQEPADAEGDTPPAPRKAAAGGRQLSRVSMALICLALVGASFVVVKSTILAPAKPGATRSSSIEEPQQRSGVAGGGGVQSLEDADGTIENGARSTGGGMSPRRSSQPGPESAPGDRDYARAFDGGTGNAIPAAQLQSEGQGLIPPGTSEIARYGGVPGMPTVPAALTRDNAPVAGDAKQSSEMPPLTIGPNSLRTAAAKGDQSAEFEIGARFAEGKGVPQDLQQAVTWYQRSAAQGFAPAQYRLGSMYERGLGVRTDLARARVWYQRAAEQGIVKAMHNLAVLSAGRDNEAADYEVAGKWFTAAAEHGLTDSQFNLAIMHDSGLGMERNAKAAYKWFSLAARAGDAEASRRRESLRGKLTPQELAEIDNELDRWRPKAANNTLNDPRVAGDLWRAKAR